MNSKTYMFRVQNWIDTERNKPLFGVQALLNGHWAHCMEDGKAVLYNTKEEALRRVRELNARTRQAA